MYAWEDTAMDPSPRETQHRVLSVLGRGTTRRIAIQREVMGSEFRGTHRVIDALKWLRDHRMVERVASGSWKITPAGRATLAMADAVMAGSTPDGAA